ncbi:MAG: V4R domain-containing protein [Gemmatimonadaceae bacterium]
MSTPTLDLASDQMVALPRSALSRLRTALLSDAPTAATALREAGYAGGESIFASFRRFLAAGEEKEPGSLTVDEFARQASHFFRASGWGTLTIGALQDAVAVVDSQDWAEADPSTRLDHPACHLTTGMFADFFGRVSPVPLAVLEVECRSMGSERCRFLLADADVMTSVYEEVERGTGYEQAVQRVGALQHA